MTLMMRRDDARRACKERRVRAAMSPAHVLVPSLLALAVVVLSGLTARWFGMGATGIWAVVAVTAAVCSVAAHRTIGSLAAGAGIRLAKPYAPGERVRVHLPRLNRTVDAEVVRVGAANTTLVVRDTGFEFDGRSGVDSIVVVPNSVMLRGTPSKTSTSA